MKQTGKHHALPSVPRTFRPVLEELAHGAGAILRRHFNRPLRIRKKPGAGIVTDADHAAETYLLKAILRKFPESSIITEESGEFRRSDELVWFLDPLDGTTNFAHGFPWFCVSIGVWQNGVPRAGAVYQPVTDELFLAERGRGAWLNGKRIGVSTERKLGDALLGTGFYYYRGAELRREIATFQQLSQAARAIRRPGSAALDMACVAAGRYDGFWERGLSSWDVAAGIVLVQEAGGKVTDYAGQPADPFGGECIATNGALHRPLLERIRRAERQR